MAAGVLLKLNLKHSLHLHVLLLINLHMCLDICIDIRMQPNKDEEKT